MSFSMGKKAILMLAICLFCSACANDRWQVDKTYDAFERKLAHSTNDINTTDNESNLYQEANSKNTAFGVESNTVFILTKHDVGSGFFIAPGIIITNKHVVKKDVRVIVISKSLKTPQLAVVQAVSTGVDQDYAILKMAKYNNSPMGLPLCTKVRVGENVSTWGFPLNAFKNDARYKNFQAGDTSVIPELIYSEGMVSEIKEEANVRIWHTANISHGNSGSPLTNSDYCVVGINSFVHTDSRTKQKSSIAIGAEDIVPFLKKHGVEPLRYQP